VLLQSGITFFTTAAEKQAQSGRGCQAAGSNRRMMGKILIFELGMSLATSPLVIVS
jgi:hypothetical protein